MRALIRNIICLCILFAVVLCDGCAQSGADEVITITTKSDSETRTTTAAASGSTAEEEEGPDREEVNLDGDGFQCNWHETVELTEEDALPEEEIPVAFAEDENFWYDVYEDHVAIAQYIGTKTVVEVPATYQGLPVTEIYGGVENSWGGGDGFGLTEVEEVILPDGLLTIGIGAFANCSNLKEINIPDSVTRIGAQAFVGTPWYESLTDEFVIVGDGILIKYNGEEESVVIPDGVKQISGAFREDEKKDEDVRLVQITIPESVTVITGYAFELCTSLESVVIPEGVVEISDSFGLCNALTAVDIPESVILLTGSFSACDALAEVTGAENVTVLSSFYNCRSLKTYPFTEGIVEIGDGAFYATALTEVDLPQSLKIIGDSAFEDCSLLTTVKNGQNVIMVGQNAFKGSAWFDSITDYFIVVGKNVLIGYNGEDTEVVVPDTVTYLGGAFSCYKAARSDDELLSLTIPASVRGICDSGFTQHPNLEELTILGENVVYGTRACSSLKLESFMFSEGTKIIPTGMFNGTELQEIEIPDSVVIIGDSAFRYYEPVFVDYGTGEEPPPVNDSVRSVEIPDSVLVIGSCAFQDCKDLDDITIPASVTRIGLDVFEGCSEDLVIHGTAGSRAESYAAEYGIRFEAIS